MKVVNRPPVTLREVMTWRRDETQARVVSMTGMPLWLGAKLHPR